MKKFLFSVIFTLLFCGFSIAQESKPLSILEKPLPELPKNYGTLDAQALIRVKVEFLANGQIGEVSLISSFNPALEQKALEAAKKIKFKPEINVGNAVTVFKVVLYDYSWKYGWKMPDQPTPKTEQDEKAEAVLTHAVANLGGAKYLQATTQIGRGRFSIISDGALVSYQTFVDVIIFPDRERTEFKSGGVKTVQVNDGEKGWIFDGEAQVFKIQSKDQIENYKRGIRTSLDYLLRGNWRGEEGVKFQSAGKRQAGLGIRNDVVKLVFADGFAVEFEFSAEGLPVKSIYKRKNVDGEDITEEDRYAQFVEVQGIKAPFIIDHFSGNRQTSRVNYENVEFNKAVPDSIFVQPKNAKDIKKDLKL